MTALTDAALNGGSRQLRSRNSRMPWNNPQSTSTLARSASIRYLEPVTVPAAPQNESEDIFWFSFFSESKNIRIHQTCLSGYQHSCISALPGRGQYRER